MSKIKIIEPGFFSTIQDIGRTGYRHKGVPLSGPMDKIAFKFAHKLVGNDYRKCLIETTLKGPTLIIEGKTKLDNIIGLDTGCVWGNKLTAIRLEDEKIFQVKKK